MVLSAQDRRLSPSGDGRRVALIIGNDAYSWNPLTNAVNDARALAALLPKAGFDPRDITLVTDANLRQMQRSGREFIEKLRPDDLAFVYYSGHGVEVRGENFLIPVDFPSNATELEVQDEAYSAQLFLRNLEATQARTRILILDACRNNPLRATRSSGGGLARMDGRGTLIVFATSAGATADDNPRGRNGLFTSHLLQDLLTPGLPMDEMVRQVAREVYRDSGARQMPAIYGLLLEDFPLVAATAPQPVPDNAATETWNLIRSSTNPADFDDFASQFPNSDLARAARVRAAQLRRNASPAVTPPVQVAANREPSRPAPIEPAPSPPIVPTPSHIGGPTAAVISIQDAIKATKDGQAANKVSGADQQTQLEALGKKMMPVIEKYAKDNGYGLILDVSNSNTPVLYASSDTDITNDIVNFYDAEANHQPEPRASIPAPALHAGVISIQGAIVSTKDGQLAIKELDDKFGPKRTAFEQEQAAIQDLEKRLGVNSPEVQRRKQRLERDMQEAQAAISADQARILRDLGQKMMAIIEKYAKANAYRLILDVSNQNTPVLYASSAIDITQDIVKSYDARENHQPEPSASAAPKFPSKTAVISIQGAIVGTKDGQHASKELDDKFLPQNAAFQQEQSAIQDLEKRLGANSSEVQNRKQRLERDMQAAEEALKADQQKILSGLGQKMMAVLEKYAKANGYSLILDVSSQTTQIPYATSGIDITSAIISLYDQTQH